MTAIIDSRPRIPRLAMVFIAAVVVMLLTAPKAGAWSATTDDGYAVSQKTGSADVTLTGYTGSETTLNLPASVTYNDATYNVTAIDSDAFKKFKNTNIIQAVNIPEGYTSIGLSAFEGFTGLTSITIPGSLEMLSSYSFESCTALQTVNFAADTASKLTINLKSFKDCSSLTEIALPKRLSSMNAGVFTGCTALQQITVADGCTNFVSDGNNLYVKEDDVDGYSLIGYAAGQNATDLTIPSEVNGKPVTSIFRLTFQNNAKLQSVTVPASVTNFQSSCFDGCSALKKVSIAAENPTIANYAFTDLAAGSVIEVANDSVVSKFTSSMYTSSKTTIQVKSAEPETEATPAASLTVKGAGVKDGYSYYTVKLDSAANVSTMIINLSFDASQVSKDAVTEGQKAAYAKVKDSRFVLTPNWKEEGGKVKVSLLLTTDNKAVTSEEASDLLLLALPVKTGVTGNIAMTVDSATCGGVVSGTTTGGTVSVNGSPASNRVTSYDVYADSKIDILDITEAQRFYQATSTGSDWATAQKADVNGDDKVDIQDLIDIFLQIEF
jgi:hypothetical protein